MKKIVYLLLLGLAGCQQEGVITEVPKDDWSVVANTAGQVKGQVNIKFKELPEDLQIVTTRSGVDTDNGQLNFVIRQLGGTRLERVFPHAGKFEARTRKAGLHLWYQVSFDENIPTAEAMKALSELPNVSIVEPIYKGKTESVSLPYNDPYLPRQWHLYNDGSNGMLAGADIRLIANARFAVVGKATEKELAKHHINADIIPAEQTGKELAGELSSFMGDNDEIKVCIFSAKEASPDLEAGLKEICELEKIDAYVNEQAYESIPESIGNMVSEAVFTSASNVERFFHMLPENTYVETAYSIGEKTTAALEQHNVREILQADDSSYEALVDTICYKA